MVNQPIKYIAEIKHVKEVALYGTANLAYWQNHLENENLVPLSSDGKAQLLISATELVYMGIKFGEITFSITAADPTSADPTGGFFLIHAFNSSRMFAFSERSMFQTPYYHGTVHVKASLLVEFKLIEGKEAALSAKMSGVVPRAKSMDEMWEGQIFLPKYVSKRNTPSGVCFAKLGGCTDTYPFSPSMDTLEFKPSQNADIIRWLLDSRFTAKEWRVRQDAEHSRSKRYQRE